MKTRNVIAFFALALMFACEPRTPQQDAKTRPAPPAADPLAAANLLTLARGASVVSRTSELSLEQSAVDVLDGLAGTTWTSAQEGRSESLVFALAAPTRVEQIGITVSNKDARQALTVRYDRSTDAKTWTPIMTVSIAPTTDPMIAKVEPFVAQYLRYSTIDAPTPFTFFREVHATGVEVQPPAPRDFGGCWTINGLAARFEQNGSRVTGVIAETPTTWVEGSTDGRVAKLMWMRGRTWGYAVVTMDPATRTISGKTFFNGMKPQYHGPAWLGERCSVASAMNVPQNIPAQLLETADRWSMYGLVFDQRDQLIDDASRPTLDSLASIVSGAPSQQFRIVAHEFHESDPARNRARTQTRIDSLRAALQKRGVDVSRIELVAGGSERDDTKFSTQIQRMMLSRIDLEPLGATALQTR